MLVNWWAKGVGRIRPLAHWLSDHTNTPAVELFKQEDVIVAAVRAFHCVVVVFQIAFFDCFVDNITGEDCDIVFDRSIELKQQAGLGLAIFFAGMPETVIAYLVEAFRQYVKKKATEELNTVNPFSLPLVGIMILVFERNVGFVHGNDPVIGDGNAKDVAGEISQNSTLTLPVGLAI